jgi:uncharacterized protein
LKNNPEKQSYEKNLIIVDGHNFIFSSFSARSLSSGRIDYLKGKLVADLTWYKYLKSWDVIVVFDARNSDNSDRGSRIVDGVKIIHSKKNETADDIIEKLAAMETGYKSIFVVTSDYLQQKVIFRKNVYRKSSREFKVELKELKRKIREDIDCLRKSYDKGFLSLEKRLSKDTRKKFSELRKK